MAQATIPKNLKRLFKIIVEEVGRFSYTRFGLMGLRHRYFKLI
jgi:hypothetical protein